METSSAETGSSQMTSLGLSASARAMQMRWRCPLEILRLQAAFLHNFQYVFFIFGGRDDPMLAHSLSDDLPDR